MSLWHEVKKEDIDFSKDGKEIHLWLYQDYNGSVYASAQVEDIKEKLKELKKRNKH